jgi:hypothetical protein
MIPVRVVGIVPVVEIVPDRVVEIVPLLVAEMTPLFGNTAVEKTKTKRAEQTVDFMVFICFLLVVNIVKTRGSQALGPIRTNLTIQSKTFSRDVPNTMTSAL